MEKPLLPRGRRTRPFAPVRGTLRERDRWMAIDSKPTLMASPHEFPEEIWGIEDPRITYVPELEKYAVAYTSFARGGPGFLGADERLQKL